ncbi:MAG TPA: AMP-binding protein, partial [Ramlibacter sp.]|nr:AMP-binding protein [Ramlibacter sp.]
GVMPALLVGAHVVVAEKFSASRYWQEAAACGATVAQTLPPMTAMLKALPPGVHDRQHSVTRMYNSRADEEFEARFGVRLVEAYGMTEIGLPIYSGYPERRQGAAGKIHPDWEMAIVDDADQPVAPGTPGELVFRPRQPWLMMQGYVGRPDATLEALRNLWFHSGDIGRQDDDGWVFFIDRRKERIRRLGENISSFDVESLVCAHPDVRECAALAHPAALGEDDVRIVVVTAQESNLTAAALYDWMTGVMPRYMLPRYIEFTQALPRTATNKIEKLKLKEAGLSPEVWDRERHQPAARARPLATTA